MHLDGLANALRHLELLPGEPAPPREDMRAVGRFVWFRTASEGWWEPEVRVGAEVRAGSTRGAVRTLFGDIVETITAPEDGVVLFLTTSPAVAADGLLLGLGADVAAL